jgi:hypothetical protein
VAQALGMSEALLKRWVRAARAQATRPAGSEALEQENKQLRAQLARAETERDILEKALTISQMLELHFRNRWADETLHLRCLTYPLLVRAAAVSGAGRQPQRVVRLADACAPPSGRARTCHLVSGGPARIHHPCRPLWPAPITGPIAARRLCSGPADTARLAQRQRLMRPLHAGRHPTAAHYPGRPAGQCRHQQAGRQPQHPPKFGWAISPTWP